MVRLAKHRRWPRMRALALKKVRSWRKARRWASSRPPRASSKGVVELAAGEGAEGLVFSDTGSASFGFSGRGGPSTVKEADPFRYVFAKNAKLQRALPKAERFRFVRRGRSDACGR